MLDLDTLRLIRRDEPSERSFSFVGVRLSPVDSKPEFWLPQGFQAFPRDDFPRTVDLFFGLFRVFRAFVSARGLSADNREDKRDPLAIGDDGLNFALTSDTPLLTFAKLNMLDAILANFDEMVISAVISKQAVRAPESHDEVYKHLHKATYLDDDRIHFEVLPSQRNELVSGPTQLVRLFCYLYAELNGRINGHDSVRGDVVAQASLFKEEHLAESAGLFVQGSFKSTLEVLKEVLDRIDRATPYKDDDFWQLFGAVEVFLYGDVTQEADADGIVWGISDFHPVWEEMCHAYTRQLVAESGDRRIMFADTPQGANDYIAGHRVVNSFNDNPFRIELGTKKRHLLPDAVLALDKMAVRRNGFDDMISVNKSPSNAHVPERIVVRAKPTIDAAQSWLDYIKKLATKAGWHPEKAAHRSQVVFRRMPSKTFDQIFEQTLRKYVGASTPDDYFVMDFKYQHPHEYCRELLSVKIQADILKQNVYELALQFHLDDEGYSECRIISQFIVPLYALGDGRPIFLTNGSMPFEMEGETLSTVFEDSGIQLVALPFDAVVQAYTQTL
jgi:hypothetical protein